MKFSECDKTNVFGNPLKVGGIYADAFYNIWSLVENEQGDLVIKYHDDSIEPELVTEEHDFSADYCIGSAEETPEFLGWRLWG